MATKRRGVVRVTVELLENMMHLPAGSILAVEQRYEDLILNEVQMVIQADFMPEVAEGQRAPNVTLLVHRKEDGTFSFEAQEAQ